MISDMDLVHLANDIRIACQRVSRRVRYESTTDLAPHQSAVLGRLMNGVATPGELAAAEMVSAPSMTRTVNELVARGYVAKDESPTDARCRHLSLTEAGRQVIARVAGERDSWMMSRLAQISPVELATLREATEILNRVLAQ